MDDKRKKGDSGGCHSIYRVQGGALAVVPVGVQVLFVFLSCQDNFPGGKLHLCEMVSILIKTNFN